MARTKSSYPKLTVPTILSPMAGVTDVAYRALCKRLGAGMTYTEFVSSAALVRDSKRTKAMLITAPEEKPVAVQLFGNSEEEVVEAARNAAERFDVIDLNCGCPAWKVVRIGAGSALLNDPEKIARLVNKVASAVNKPVTIKIRAGPDKKRINAVKTAQLAEDAGAAAVAVHGRTVAQGYSGTADWNVVKQVKEAITIPVIGNGDVFTPEEYVEKKNYSNCDAVMIARGAIGNPLLFAQIKEQLASGKYEVLEGDALKASKKKLFEEYAKLAAQYKIPYTNVKSHASNFTKGLPSGARIRERLSRAKSLDEVRKIMAEY